MGFSEFNLNFDFSLPVNFSDPKPSKAFADLPMTASYLAYKCESDIRNVVAGHWKRNFVEYFSCSNDTQAFIFTDAPRDAKLIVLAFRGTEILVIDDWLTDLNLTQVVIKNRNQWRQNVGSVHRGFLQALINVASDPFVFPADNNDHGGKWAYYSVKKKLLSLVKEHPNAKVLVTGHSLGGALAVLFSLLLSLERKDMVDNARYKVISFGQPRVGNEAFAHYMEKVVQFNYSRVVYAHDLVARLPPDLPLLPFPNFKHFGVCIFYKNWNEEEVVREVPNQICYFRRVSDVIRDRPKQCSIGYSWSLIDMVKAFCVPTLHCHDKKEYLMRSKSGLGSGGSFRA